MGWRAHLGFAAVEPLRDGVNEQQRPDPERDEGEDHHHRLTGHPATAATRVAAFLRRCRRCRAGCGPALGLAAAAPGPERDRHGHNAEERRHCTDDGQPDAEVADVSDAAAV
jgi:hypothetical protein